MDAFFWYVGAGLSAWVCVLAVIGLVWVSVNWAFEKLTNVAVAIRIIRHAREHGIDLLTGKPVEDDDRPAH